MVMLGLAVISLVAVLTVPTGQALAAAGDVTPANASYLVLPETAQTVTNGQAVTITGSNYDLTAVGSGDGFTNTITLANATAAHAGLLVVLKVNAASSNLVGIADSAPMKLTAAWVGNDDDSLMLISDGTNWCELGRNAN